MRRWDPKGWVRQRRLELILIAVAGAAVTTSLTVRPKPQFLALEAEASSVRFALGEQLVSDWSVPLRPGGLTLGAIGSGSIDGVATDGARMQSLLAAGAPSIDRLVLAKGSSAQLERGEDGCIGLSMRSGSAQLDLTLGEQALAVAIEGDPAGASDIRLCPLTEFRLALFGIDRLDFESHYSPNATQAFSMSSMRSATVSFPVLGIERTVPPLAGLFVNDVVSDQPVMVVGPKDGAMLETSLTAEVGGIATGSAARRRDLMPRLFEHLVGTAPLATALAGFGFFWGLLWGIARFVRPSPQRR